MGTTKLIPQKEWLIRGVIFFAICLGIAGLLLVTQLFALSQVGPSSLDFDLRYREIYINWSDVETEPGEPNPFYVVYRSEDTSGTNAARIAITEKSEFIDSSLIPGATHSYIVMSGTDRASINAQNPTDLNWGETEIQKVPAIGPLDKEGNPVTSPHQGDSYDALSKEGCNACHLTHDAANPKLIESSGNSNRAHLVNALCADCHEDDSAIEKQFVGDLYSTNTSGHLTDSVARGDSKIECVTCHGPHQDSADEDASLLPETVLPFGSLTSALEVNQDDKAALCVTCHDDDQTWWTATNNESYPDSKTPIKLNPNDPETAEGYEHYRLRGTFPGKSIAQNPSINTHARILESTGRDQGDCRYCHTSHSSDAPYSGLKTARGEYRAMIGEGNSAEIEAERLSADYASFCLSCHNGSNLNTPWERAVDIASLVAPPPAATPAEKTEFLASHSGHKITDAAGVAEIPAGSHIPCYVCHSPHGSRYGNARNINDELVQGISKAQLGRDFCFTCHVTKDGFVLKDDASGYRALSRDSEGNISTDEKILGLSRSGFDEVEGVKIANKLVLPNLDSAIDSLHMSSDTGACYDCHGSAHSPVKPQITGGITITTTSTLDGNECLDCHEAQYQSAVGLNFSSDGTVDGDEWDYDANPHMWSAFSTRLGVNFRPESTLLGQPDPDDQNIQASSLGLYCVSCHGWHSSDIGSDQSNTVAGYQGGNSLRASYNSYDAANSDFVYDAQDTNAQTGGLCLSCHNDNLGTTSVGAPTRGPLNDRNRLNMKMYEASGHNYDVVINRNATDSTIEKTFNANCVKCHTTAEADSNPKANRDELSLNGHHVAGKRQLAQIGFTADIVTPSTHTDPNVARAQNFNNKGMCFGCHTRSGEIVGNAGKKYAGEDFYGAASTRSMYQEEYKSASGTVIGVQRFNSEAVLDDMYKIPQEGFSQSATRLQLQAKEEISGHQPSLALNIDRDPSHSGQASDKYALNSYVRWNMDAIRCSECHNVHSTNTNSMGTHGDWPFTQKPLPASDATTPSGAIAADGTRLITLNDYYRRYDIISQWNFKTKITNILVEARGLTAAEAEEVYAEMQYNGISAADLSALNEEMYAAKNWRPYTATEISEWGKTVDIFCFRCHSNVSMFRAAHAKTSHRTKGLACVSCHIPQTHGGKMSNLLGDRGSIPGIDGRAAGQVSAGHGTMQPHQIVTWTDYSTLKTKAQNEASTTPQSYNQPVLKLLSSSVTYTDQEWQSSKNQCSTAPGCHAVTAGTDVIGSKDGLGRTLEHWIGND